MISEAFSYSTVEIANSFDGKSAVFAIDLSVDIAVKLVNDRDIIFSDKSFHKFNDIVKKTLDYFGYGEGCIIDIKTKIPENSGLGFKEAVISAIILGISGAISSKNGSILELKIDKYMKEQIMEVNGKLVNIFDLIRKISDDDVRFDRLFASYFGGFIAADNIKKEILRRGEMESLYVSLIIPKRIRMNKHEFKPELLFKNEAEVIFTEALKGNLYTAMKLNGLLYDKELIKKALSLGAITATVNRNGVLIALSRDKKTAERISDNLVFRVANKKAIVKRKPMRVIRVNEFLKIKGKNKFYWI